ncbi:MAG: DegT/DnrJ/EryC1/StrS family aminotransferase [Alphaproteobacteria bacterium]|nr:DegT/DnrJ/EryC1/StrS family aminotransferase [Alphaproteobacteria bacterium]
MATRDKPVPQAAPIASYRAARSRIDRAVARVLASGRYILGPEVEAFEREFAAYIGCRHAVGVASGTDALILALRALGLPPGTTVATASHTAVATVAAIELAGLAPLLLDIDPATYTLAPAAFERALAGGLRVGAAIAVHLYGQAADLGALLPLARRHGVKVIEDCAQSHGATLGGQRLGSFGDVACFSFYPTKNLGAFGDAGAVLTDDAARAARVRALREYGWRERYVSATPGMNSRLDPIQAAVLRVKLTGLDRANARRAALAARYDRGLANADLGLPQLRPGATHVFHQYVVRAKRRDDLRAALDRAGIGTAVHYPMPVHLQPAYAGRVALDPGGLGESERAAREVLSLPMFPELGAADIARVVGTIKASLCDAGT